MQTTGNEAMALGGEERTQVSWDKKESGQLGTGDSQTTPKARVGQGRCRARQAVSWVAE